jgi:hypothetical protein
MTRILFLAAFAAAAVSGCATLTESSRRSPPAGPPSLAPRPSLPAAEDGAFLHRHALGLSHLVHSGSDLGQARLAVPSVDAEGLGAEIEAAEADRDAAAAANARAHVGALRGVGAVIPRRLKLGRGG